MSTRRYDPPHLIWPAGPRRRNLRAKASFVEWESQLGTPETSRRRLSVLSVVVAAKNEAPSLAQLMDEIARALRPLCRRADSGLADFEIVLVDDGSTDETQQVLPELRVGYPELSWLTLAISSGQSAATAAGIQAARGDWIATLDADLQNDPSDLVALWNALPGHDAVLGWRKTREDVLSRRLISICANWVRNAILGQSIRDTGCSVRIFSRASALRLPLFFGMHRFIGPLLLRDGCKLMQVPVNHRPRASGRTNYNMLNRSINVLVDMLGVVWLLRRPVRYRVIAHRESETSPRSLPSEERVLADHRGYKEG